MCGDAWRVIRWSGVPEGVQKQGDEIQESKMGAVEMVRMG